MIAYLKLLRWPNLIFIALTLILIKFSFFEEFGAAITLNAFGYALLILATLCIAASGYVINDIYDIQADKINKPEKLIVGNKISEKNANNLFITLNVIGVAIGFYLANLLEKPAFVAIFIFSSALLYLYASYLKQIPVLGNVLISFLVAFVVLLPAVFDLFPAISPQNKKIQSLLFSILLDYVVFAFLLNLLREMVKDHEDIKGDYNAGIKTLPIVLGQSRTNKIIFAIGILPIAAMVYYIYNYLFENTFLVIYSLLFILAPLLYFQVRLWEAKKKKDYTHLSLMLKIILFFGLISIGFYQFLL
ncbi:geranylgeranylglycerol-phosphate geranylgeranyltransferase [Salegentibacter salarius]|uniref:Prenyltransferase n=1 Tax=Salegentibacter salarius TaxID=435906 RepID=A0A2N0TTJ4_9FLAO|nr:geranylgeranylglycerol-phosphate geranylgeranyltransferase [Salegentibacter salarius]OEY72406.1 prenyltransferase [Salegentibacter salarius]PKD18062.1 prenyltransferase [Salegentibacter salarius]SLK03818.1 4-hydroxybenzoate polyprenyltransferase [Salegentibacter salarius]